MELRLDRLLTALRERPAEVLEAIDRDPLLLKKESGGLVLANASQELYTPQLQYQLYAKGIVYRRDPYRLASLPLIKIYNLGERDVSAAELVQLCAEPGVGVRFLRKLDGSLVQLFEADGRAWLTTRGLIEGARGGPDPGVGADGAGGPDFDYLGAARALLRRDCPRLLDEPALLGPLTLVFELIHPGAPKVTNYGGRADLTLLACFDRRRCAYAAYPELCARAAAFGLPVVDALSPTGATLPEQIAALLAALAGTDQEGSVLNFERGDEVIYRVKVKSPDYLRLLRAMALCTYERTAELADARPDLTDWPEFEVYLKSLGRDQVPEEVLGYYRPHFERHRSYLADCERLLARALAECAALEEGLGGRTGRPPAEYRKAFAALATKRPLSGLLFAALDGRLDLARVRQAFRSAAEARRACEEAL
jgi:hypothetical protein